MAEQAGDFRRIDWNELFPFTQIFRSFRIAVQPAKLGLALVGVILTGALGYLLDVAWSPTRHLPVGPEVWAYWQVPDIDAWRSAQLDERRAALETVHRSFSSDQTPPTGEVERRGEIEEAQRRLKAQYRARVAELMAADRAQDIPAEAARYTQAYNLLDAYRTRGLFDSFLDYQRDAVGRFLQASRSMITLDWSAINGGASEVLQARYLLGDPRQPGDLNGIGMTGSLLLMLRGVQWLLFEHQVFALLLLAGTLAIWSLIGGAICRMSALTAARDEQISARSALNFAARKFLGFASAPLLVLLMIVLIGFVMALGGLVLMGVPYLGDVVGPMLLILALVGGFVMALVVVGAIGGGSMMWPTIGVEGSDGFDAISRSYSYFYSRPWRTAFYALVAAAYGALTYLLLRYLVYLVFKLTRFFVGVGLFWTRRPGTGDPQATKLEAMWPMPTPDNLIGDWAPLLGLIRWERAGAAIIHVWVVLVVLLLLAYLLSYFFSASTIIYLLLRRHVDATDVEDVYMEEEDEVYAPALSSATIGAPSDAPASTPPEGPGGSSADPKS